MHLAVRNLETGIGLFLSIQDHVKAGRRGPGQHWDSSGLLPQPATHSVEGLTGPVSTRDSDGSFCCLRSFFSAQYEALLDLMFPRRFFPSRGLGYRLSPISAD